MRRFQVGRSVGREREATTWLLSSHSPPDPCDLLGRTRTGRINHTECIDFLPFPQPARSTRTRSFLATSGWLSTPTGRGHIFTPVGRSAGHPSIVQSGLRPHSPRGRRQAGSTAGRSVDRTNTHHSTHISKAGFVVGKKEGGEL